MFLHVSVKCLIFLYILIKIPISLAGLRAVGYILYHQTQQGDPVTSELLLALNQAIKHESNDVKHLVALVSTFIAKSSQSQLPFPVIKVKTYIWLHYHFTTIFFLIVCSLNGQETLMLLIIALRLRFAWICSSGYGYTSENG